MTMDTKTLKQEALALLALDELTPTQRARLNILTADQAGYDSKAMTEDEYQEARLWLAPFPQSYWLVRNGAAFKYVGLEFCVSVDACLMLQLPGKHFWDLGTATQGVEGDYPSAEIMDAAHFEHGNHQYAKTLSLAMLRAWWQMQPE